MGYVAPVKRPGIYIDFVCVGEKGQVVAERYWDINNGEIAEALLNALERTISKQPNTGLATNYDHRPANRR